jgi:signal transduction histidine kinase
LYGILNWSAPRVDGKRDLSRVAVAIVDITERKEAEDRLSRLIRSKDEFLASVSHELRTPLTTVYASAETLLEQDHVMDEDLRTELVGYIARESGELSDMVEDLLVAARHEIGTITVVPKQTDLLPIVERVVEVAFAEHHDRDVAVEVTGSVWADPLRLKQIVRNLVTNAIRYGGRSVRILSENVGDDTFLTVLDNGPGVSESRRESVFEMYERDHGNLAAVEPVASVGVGLAVARQLADLMQGDLDYEYRAGWSRFKLRLPSAPAIPAALANETDGIVTYVHFDRNAS